MDIYQVHLLKDRNRPGPVELHPFLTGLGQTLKGEGVGVFGLFYGLFGLASNESYLVLHGSEAPNLAPHIKDTPFDLLESIDLVPTVRPQSFAPRTEPGIYVFRWFEVLNRDVDEIAALSKKAWETFEGGFDTQVQGLFAEPDRTADRGRMLLITWYRNLTVWQDSRQPAPEARENFQRRHQLTLEARPIATRLII